MILVQLLGGLGNQMFQYAAGRALAERHGVPLKLNVSALHNFNPTDTPRRYALEPFAIEAPLATTAELRTFSARRRLHLAHRLQEQGTAFNQAFMYAGPRTALIGYWQSERYFADIAPTVRREFTIRAAPSARDESLLNEIRSLDAVSVHIRRGDYVTNATINALHGLLPPSYYQEAAAGLADQIAAPHFYIFSDDPAWAREHLTLPGPITVIDHHGPDDACEDLRLMCACKYHIVANSSFSWWGAWLSERPGKIVVAPRQWFRSPDVDASDICPPEWIRL